MKSISRRRFFAFPVLAAPAAVIAAPEEDASEGPHKGWWETIEEHKKFTAKSEESEVVLDVEITIPPHEAAEPVEGPDGVTGYKLNGKLMPERFWPGESILTKFELKWDGKPVKIEERFWSDLAGFGIQTHPKTAADVEEKCRGDFETFLESLHRPRVFMSGGKGTVLIEWKRSEECDRTSIIRWMISRSGTVLRHQQMPAEDC